MNRFEQSVGGSIAVLALAGVACIAGWKGFAEHVLILLILPIMWNFDSFQKFLHWFCRWLFIDCRVEDFCKGGEIYEFKGMDSGYVTFQSESRGMIRSYLRDSANDCKKGFLVVSGPRHAGKSMFVRNELKAMGARVFTVRESAWMSEDLTFRDEFKQRVKALFSGLKCPGCSKCIALVLRSDQLFIDQIQKRKELVDSVKEWYDDFPEKTLDVVIDFVGIASFVDKEVKSFTVPYLSKKECYDFAVGFSSVMKTMKWSDKGGFAVDDVAKQDDVERVLFYQTRGVPSAIVALLCPEQEKKIVDEILSGWRALLCSGPVNNDLRMNLGRVKFYYAFLFVLSLLKDCTIDLQAVLSDPHVQQFVDCREILWFMCVVSEVSAIKPDEFDVNLFLETFPEELLGVSLQFDGAQSEYDFCMELQMLLQVASIRKLIRKHVKEVVRNINGWIFPQGSLWKTVPRRFSAVLRLQDWLFGGKSGDGTQMVAARNTACEILKKFLMTEVYTRDEMLPSREVSSVCVDIIQRIAQFDAALRVDVLSKVMCFMPFSCVADLPQLGLEKLLCDIKMTHVLLSERHYGLLRLIRLRYAIILAQAQWMNVAGGDVQRLMDSAALMDEALPTWSVGEQWNGLCNVFADHAKAFGAVIKSSDAMTHAAFYEAMSKLAEFSLNNIGFVKREGLAVELSYAIITHPYNRHLPVDVDLVRSISRMLSCELCEILRLVGDGQPLFENLRVRLRMQSIGFSPWEEVKPEDLDWMLTEVAACWNDSRIDGYSSWILDKACCSFANYIRSCNSDVGADRFIDYFYQQIGAVEKYLAVPNLIWYLAYLSRMLSYKFLTDAVRAELSKKIVAPFNRCVDRVRMDIELICTRDVCPLAEVLATNYQYVSDSRFNAMTRELFLFDKRILRVVDPEVKQGLLQGLVDVVSADKGRVRCDLRMSAMFLVERILKIVFSNPDADFRSARELKHVSTIGYYKAHLMCLCHLIKESDLFEIDEADRAALEMFDRCVADVAAA